MGHSTKVALVGRARDGGQHGMNPQLKFASSLPKLCPEEHGAIAVAQRRRHTGRSGTQSPMTNPLAKARLSASRRATMQPPTRCASAPNKSRAAWNGCSRTPSSGTDQAGARPGLSALSRSWCCSPLRGRRNIDVPCQLCTGVMVLPHASHDRRRQARDTDARALRILD